MAMRVDEEKSEAERPTTTVENERWLFYHCQMVILAAAQERVSNFVEFWGASRFFLPRFLLLRTQDRRVFASHQATRFVTTQQEMTHHYFVMSDEGTCLFILLCFVWELC